MPSSVKQYPFPFLLFRRNKRKIQPRRWGLTESEETSAFEMVPPWNLAKHHFSKAHLRRVAVELRLNSTFSYFLSAEAWKKVSKKVLPSGGKNSPRAPELLRSVSPWNPAQITEMQLQLSKWSTRAAYGAIDLRFGCSHDVLPKACVPWKFLSTLV